MAVQLPLIFKERMQSILKDEYDTFLQSYDQTPTGGIRVNTLKISVADLLKLTPFKLQSIPWCPSGFYTEAGARPGLHPYYHAGLYYIQEPSAMAPVELLDVQPEEFVLDLCAAPGGKSTQIAAKLQGQGILVSNDLNSERTKALAKNLELYGVRNGVVLNEHPDRISHKFPRFFHKILIDAPCSGEGMFRKDEDMVKQWTEESPEKYAGMQRDILRSAASMLRSGGRIVYSTCTFSPEENEGMIAEFLNENSDFHVIPVGGTTEYFASGETAWTRNQMVSQQSISDGVWDQVAGTARLWPHKIQGEGHFIAVLQHHGEPTTEGNAVFQSTSENVVEPLALKQGKKGSKQDRGALKRGHESSSEAEAITAYHQFVKEHLSFVLEGHTIVYGQHIYQSSLPHGSLDKLKVIRPGWNIGFMKNGRFIPGHPLATALQASECVRVIDLSSETGEAVKYLKGETLEINEERVTCTTGATTKGYALICIDGYSAGWGKWQNGILKNEYPAGWRWTSV
ncbi:RsmB/NOP family class I SAM-dependent RNA methyltransferase [Paenibacillus sp. IHBB 10380]|uniref:RsmB/NOP family class I SAM-dependent RNA methyltransferase n=1 Tax=Paenibacillus sp. IHBB 10380 TaxID=1566358 RepID=UPI0005CFD363|nr:RsmB/NOP family class I SAM-dependent RNA methyltransferase [Paenibacillus sp. IHBB 10380]AJS59410.1 rRNA cytosine-C5-methyltransferase [Paenibacillus sp. IHBB 10380]